MVCNAHRSKLEQGLEKCANEEVTVVVCLELRWRKITWLIEIHGWCIPLFIHSFICPLSGLLFVAINSYNRMKQFNWADSKIIICYYHILFRDWSKFVGTNFMTFHKKKYYFYLSNYYIITVVYWDSNTMSYFCKGVLETRTNILSS